MEYFIEGRRELVPADWKELEVDEIPLVLEEMSKEGKQSLFVVNYIRGILKWSRSCPDMKTKIYRSKNIQWLRSVIATTEGKETTAFIFSPYKSCSFIMSALRGNDIIKWKKEPTIYLKVPKEILGRLAYQIISNGVPAMLSAFIFNSYWLPSETAKKFKINVPDGFTISRLDHSHASTVNSVWPYASSTSPALVSDMIRVNETVGLLTEKGSRLVSWVLHAYYGLGMLYTVKEHRKRGHGATVVKALSKRLAEEGTEITLLARENNAEANAMFRKLGFQETGPVQMIKFRVDPRDETAR